MSPDTRTRLLATARDLYLEVGPNHLSLREVARRAGVSAPAVYRHFDGKDALIAAVCQEGLRIFYGYLLGALAEVDPLGRLRMSGAQYLRFALENRRDYRVIFMSEPELLHLGKTPVDKGGPAQAPTFQFLVDRVRECQKARVLRRGDAIEAATMIWAHVHGLASLRLSGQLDTMGDDDTFALFFRRSTDQLLAGMA